LVRGCVGLRVIAGHAHLSISNKPFPVSPIPCEPLE